MPNVGFSDRARDDLADKRRQEDKEAIGGMRNPRLAVKRLTRLQVIGKLISRYLGYVFVYRIILR